MNVKTDHWGPYSEDDLDSVGLGWSWCVPKRAASTMVSDALRHERFSSPLKSEMDWKTSEDTACLCGVGSGAHTQLIYKSLRFAPEATVLV